MRRISEVVACYAGHPFSQAGFLLFCAIWWALGGSLLALTTVLSILAITLSQMVLAGQQRDTLALKLQIAELVHAVPGARDEVADADRLSEDEIERLREGK